MGGRGTRTTPVMTLS